MWGIQQDYIGYPAKDIPDDTSANEQEWCGDESVARLSSASRASLAALHISSYETHGWRSNSSYLVNVPIAEWDYFTRSH